MPRVLLIEDDSRIRASLATALADRGHDVTTEATGLAGLQRALEDEVEVVVLDLGLPDVDGAEVLQMIRSIREVPVIVGTAQDDESDIVRLLNAGADDYLVKPFSAAQLDARIGAVLRRVQGQAMDEGRLIVGDLEIDTAAREAFLKEEPVELTRREFDLLSYLAEREGTVIGKRELLAEIWRQPYGGADKTVDVHLSWLRRKLGESAAQPAYLHTVREIGIKLVDPTA